MSMEEVMKYAERNGFFTRNNVENFENIDRVSFFNKEDDVHVIMRPEYADEGKVYEMPEISWSSIGSKPIDDAKRFSHDMDIAINIAEYLDIMRK